MNNARQTRGSLRSEMDRFDGVSPLDHERPITSGAVTAHFHDIERHLCEFIHESQIVVGCVAWLTSEPVLRALAARPCQIVVQKEDWLRPDLGNAGGWRGCLRGLYDACSHRVDRLECPLPLSEMGYCGNTLMDNIRCVGNHNSTRAAAVPRSHHKFIVRCTKRVYQDGRGIRLRPLAVWTGSYNFTQNATKSFENAVVIKDETIARAYLHEWAQIAALSEPLDWTADWVEPEWRIGS